MLPGTSHLSIIPVHKGGGILLLTDICVIHSPHTFSMCDEKRTGCKGSFHMQEPALWGKLSTTVWFDKITFIGQYLGDE